MKKGKIGPVRFAGGIALCVTVFCLTACLRDSGWVYGEEKQGQTAKDSKEDWNYPLRSMFSWESDVMEPAYWGELDWVMGKLNCSTVFQEIQENSDKDTVKQFLNRQAQSGREVYAMAGGRDWGLDGDLSKMEKILRYIAEVNAEQEEKSRFKGIVWDVEPYLSDAWDKAPERVMEQYTDNCAELYRQAGSAGLKTILCIPYYYDQMNYVEQLERLISEGCDGIAVMNYNKKDEIGQIKNEEYLSRKHGKVLIQITELQKEGKHELTEENTYYSDGIPAVERSWERLSAAFPEAKLGFSYHYLKPAAEILERDGQRR